MTTKFDWKYTLMKKFIEDIQPYFVKFKEETFNMYDKVISKERLITAFPKDHSLPNFDEKEFFEKYKYEDIKEVSDIFYRYKRFGSVNFPYSSSIKYIYDYLGANFLSKEETFNKVRDFIGLNSFDYLNKNNLYNSYFSLTLLVSGGINFEKESINDKDTKITRFFKENGDIDYREFNKFFNLKLNRSNYDLITLVDFDKFLKYIKYATFNKKSLIQFGYVIFNNITLVKRENYRLEDEKLKELKSEFTEIFESYSFLLKKLQTSTMKEFEKMVEEYLPKLEVEILNIDTNDLLDENFIEEDHPDADEYLRNINKMLELQKQKIKI